MTAADNGAQSGADAVAREAARYLKVVELFATLGADPHAAAIKRRGVLGWRT